MAKSVEEIRRRVRECGLVLFEDESVAHGRVSFLYLSNGLSISSYIYVNL